MPTETEVRAFISAKLPDESEIPATDHRDVENKIMDFIVQEIGLATKTKVLLLETFTTDRNYSVNTGLTGVVIESVVVMLVCKTANNGFLVNDTVNVCTPYPRDAGRTTAQGVGFQFNNADVGSVKVVVNKEITIMTAYDSVPGADASHINFSGGATANWSVKLIVGYK